MGMFDRLIRTVVNEAADSVGDAIGDAVGGAVEKVTDQAANNFVEDMKRDNEVKQMKIEEQKKITQLPSHCPFCKAPTTGQLVCEYCNSKIM